MTERLTFGRPFVIRRDRDISGVSGTGIILDGVLWPDGQAVIHWRGKWALTTPHPSMESILDIHDHGGQGDLHVIWADEVEAARREGLADIVEAYDLPVALFGTEAEGAYLHRQISRSLLNAWEARGSVVAQPEEHCATFADAVMPIVRQLLVQRDRAQGSAGRAYKLADRWEAAHGSANFLVRAAGAELRDELDDDQAGCPDLAAAECSAQYYKANAGPTRQCIRAAQHRGDHIDEHGFHWSDTVAVYPVVASPERTRGQRLLDAFLHRGPSYELGANDRQACPYCTGGPQFLRSELGAHVEQKHARVLAVLAAGGSLDEQLDDAETQRHLPHEMEV